MSTAALARFILGEELCSLADVRGARRAQQEQGRSLAWHLHQRGALSEFRLAQALSRQLNTPLIQLHEFDIDPTVATCVSEGMARCYRMIPVNSLRRSLILAVVDPFHLQAVEEARFLSNHREVHVVVATDSAIETALDLHWPKRVSTAAPVPMMAHSTVDEWRRSWPRRPLTTEAPESAEDAAVAATDTALFGRRRAASQG